jgi:nucleoside-diphosphate-sugar epimerase
MTGHDGYIGAVMAPILTEAGHEVVGLDTGFFSECGFEDYPGPSVEGRRGDVRDAEVANVVGFDAVVHLAALSNDPLGNLDPELTYEINHRASVALARMAKDAGVERFVFASSCSLYGAQGDAFLDESAAFNPLTPYGKSKILSEQGIAELADDDFSPTFMRNATAYGLSPRLRADIVVNNLVGHACTQGEVLIQSDGTPWRPLVHVRDFSNAFLAALEAPREVVHNEAFNVGRTAENYQVRELAEIVDAAVPGSRIEYAEGGGPDPRSYRVDCSKIETQLPGYAPEWTVERGVRELVDAFTERGMTSADFFSQRYFRIQRIRALLDGGRLDGRLKWRAVAAAKEDSR